ARSEDMSKRRAKSSISRLPAEQRASVERMLREDRLTLDEMIAELQRQFPGEPAAEVSRSALHRYERGFTELTARMREIEAVSDAVIGELGEGVGEKAGALLAQAVTTLATNAALQAHGNDKITIDEIRKLARAAKDAMDTQRVGVNLRKAIADEARQALLREQSARLDKVVKSDGLSEQTAADMRKKILGIG
ncbi:MAG: phage protein Gp27 family protein, partial [Pseudomonas sp.]|uniref:phage protein Gp27 family protein n=1 Tax=Pseudomonas sp. TaxID=306 RepID=UPI003D6F6EA1